jgi:hypothetical protein
MVSARLGTRRFTFTELHERDCDSSRRKRTVSVSVSSRSLHAHSTLSTTVSKDGSAPLGQHKY